MLHAVRIRGGKASFCNRWVRTSRLEQEEKAGWALHTKSEQAGAGAMVGRRQRGLALLVGGWRVLAITCHRWPAPSWGE